MAGKTDTRSTRQRSASARSAPPGELSLKKALFEIVIVAIGVLLALGVDEWRETRSDRALVEQSRKAMLAETDQNRIRLATKLSLIHNAYLALEKDPGAGPRLVGESANFQITPADAAWNLAIQTGALRLFDDQARQKLAYIYSSQDIYKQLLAEEMSHWTALAASGKDEAAVKLWKAYAQRVAVGACIATIRIERFRNPALSPERMRRTCLSYRLNVAPSVLYRQLGLKMPDSNWRPGSEF